MPRHPGLVNLHPGDEVIDGALAAEEGLDNLQATGIGEGLKYCRLHDLIYVSLCIYGVKHDHGASRTNTAVPGAERETDEQRPTSDGISAGNSRTRAFLQRIPPGQWHWRPHPKSFTVGGLAAHLVDCVRWVESIVPLDELDIDPTTFRPCSAGSLEELLALYDAAVATGTFLLSQTDTATMTGPWRLKLRGKTRLERPKTEAVRDFTLNHLIHHRGQLSVYLRLLDVPVPGAYGPTADERGCEQHLAGVLRRPRPSSVQRRRCRAV